MRSNCRVTVFGVVLLLLTSFVFAGGTSEGAKGAAKKTEGTVYYLCPNQLDEFQTYASALMKKLIEKAGYKYQELVAGNEDLHLQLSQLEDCLTQNPAAIIIASVDSVAVVDGVKKARAKGVPVIVFDRDITETVTDFASVAGFYKIGLLSGEEIARLLKEKYGAVKGTVLNIMGDPASMVAVLIDEGFRKVMDQYPEVKIVSKPAQGWEASNAASAAENWLVANPKTEVIFTHAEHMASAVVEVAKAKGYKKGEIIMVSSTGMPMGLNLIRDGWLQATVQQPLIAEVEGVAMFLDDVTSKKVIKPGQYKVGGDNAEVILEKWGPVLYSPGSVVDSKNVDDPNHWGNQVNKK